MHIHKIKDEIIDFVRNSPEEVNSKVAVFIAGMQAQKDLTDCLRNDSALISEMDGVSIMKNGLNSHGA